MWIQHLNGISTFTLFNFTDLINFSRQTQFWRIKYPFRAAFEDVSKQDLGHHCQTYREKDRCCSPRSCYCAVMRCTAGWAYICMLYVTVWLSMQSVGESRTPAHCLCARKSTWCIKLLLSPLLLHRQLCLLLQHIFLMKILRFNFFYQALALTTGTVAFDARQLRTKSISNISCPLIHRVHPMLVAATRTPPHSMAVKRPVAVTILQNSRFRQRQKWLWFFDTTKYGDHDAAARGTLRRKNGGTLQWCDTTYVHNSVAIFLSRYCSFHLMITLSSLCMRRGIKTELRHTFR